MDNRTDFNFYKDATQAAQGTKGNALPAASFGAFRMFARSVNQAIRNDYAEKEKQKASFKEELSSKRAQEKSLELDNIFKVMVTGKQDVLTRTLAKLENNTRNAVKKFALIPPTPEGIMKIENAEKRIDSISETEWLMLAEDVADNYQEAALLKSVAAKHGKDYDIPFEPGKATENLDNLVSMLKKEVIANIGEDPLEHMNMATFFRHEPGVESIYGMMNLYAEYFDTLPVATVTDVVAEMENADDLTARMKEARFIAWKNKANTLWEEFLSVDRDIQKNGLTDENTNKAEKLIRIVNEQYTNGAENA